MLMLRQLSTVILLCFTSVLAAQHGQHGHQHPIQNSDRDNMSGIKSLNVFKRPLQQHSTQPMTGFLRNGYCDVPAADFGNHAVAAEVTDEFLKFSASRGNDLTAAGLTGGCKWCLCASRWLEAFQARDTHPDGDRIVPKVWLNATNEKALNKVDLGDLRKFAVDKEGE